MIGVSEGQELPCGFWEFDPGTLEEQPVLLNAQQSLQPLSQNLKDGRK